jgi:hypothetical protein
MGKSSGIVVRRTRVEWERLVRQWQRSEQPAREFGDAHGIRPDTLVWWKWRLGTEAKVHEPTPRLVPVQVVDSVVEATGAGDWELTSGTGVRLRVRGRLSGSDLRIVLDALTSGSLAGRRR